jgi:hypothetical protein
MAWIPVELTDDDKKRLAKVISAGHSPQRWIVDGESRLVITKSGAAARSKRIATAMRNVAERDAK